MELKSFGLILASFSSYRTARLACGQKTEKVEKPVSYADRHMKKLWVFEMGASEYQRQQLDEIQQYLTVTQQALIKAVT
jgi:hypothetical protein